MSPEAKKKYFMYYRVEHDKLSKTSFYLAAVTTGVLKYNLLVIIHIITILGTKIVCFGADPSKPYSRLRRGLVDFQVYVLSRISIFCFGYHFLNIRKVRIQDYDPSYPE